MWGVLVAGMWQGLATKMVLPGCGVLRVCPSVAFLGPVPSLYLPEPIPEVCGEVVLDAAYFDPELDELEEVPGSKSQA